VRWQRRHRSRLKRRGLEPPVGSLSGSVDQGSPNARGHHVIEQDDSGFHPPGAPEREQPTDILVPKREEFLEGLQRLANPSEEEPGHPG
jgi:hypothetical protein